MTIEQMRAVENAQTKYIVNFLAKEIETDDYLAERIANTELSIKDCMMYIKAEVKKKAIDNIIDLLKQNGINSKKIVIDKLGNLSLDDLYELRRDLNVRLNLKMVEEN